jgi:hypothetical protein
MYKKGIKKPVIYNPLGALTEDVTKKWTKNFTTCFKICMWCCKYTSQKGLPQNKLGHPTRTKPIPATSSFSSSLPHATISNRRREKNW